MSRVPYRKPALVYQDQLNQLKSRGLLVSDDQKAIHLLAHVSYYRLSGYWYPLLADKQTHQFKAGATFETAFRLYCFDRELRKLVLAELEKIEVAVRAQLIYILSHQFGPFWFNNTSLFVSLPDHEKLMEGLQKEYARSDEQFVNAFRQKYAEPLPPSWMLFEITSFGTLSLFYKNLAPGPKRQIANLFGLDEQTFGSWLHCIVYLRNVCAHHSRLWNRTMSIRPRIPRTPHHTWVTNQHIRNDRTYFALCMIRYMLNVVNPGNRFPNKLNGLLTKYPEIDKTAMGFDSGWQRESLWQ